MAVPDAQIHEHATGVALKTVEAHSEPQDLVFYSGWFCPFVQRTWITLEEKKVPYQYKEVNPYRKEEHFLAINPKGLVPAIEYKSKALYESLVLCEFIEDAYPDHAPHILPSDPFERARARLWVDHITKAVIPTYFRLIQSQEADKQDEARNALYKALSELSKEAKGPWFLGEQFSLVDIAVAPWALRDYIASENRGYRREAVGNGWKEWAERLETRESVVNTTSEKEYYAEIYGRYLRDEAQSEAAKAIRDGKVIP
ncbi:glutathione-S-transferase [Athelia psychrophila]|uniref:Glutathione-dependent dehydroascorbate reductase n=1 Tax=Athelia psychrophila TaxID=1759441 RepID=A0A166RQ16_9AGAM|nr:glutathione-S-transferase [Fibularhizoctonia sp. CBS 109695]